MVLLLKTIYEQLVQVRLAKGETKKQYLRKREHAVPPCLRGLVGFGEWWHRSMPITLEGVFFGRPRTPAHLCGALRRHLGKRKIAERALLRCFKDRGASCGGTQISTTPRSCLRMVEGIVTDEGDRSTSRVFLDIGCGQGRVVGAASTVAAFSKVVGVEVDALTSKMARKNLKKFCNRAHVKVNPTVLCADAHMFDDLNLCDGETVTHVTMMNCGFPIGLQYGLLRALCSSPGLERVGLILGDANNGRENVFLDCLKHAPMLRSVDVRCGGKHTMAIFDWPTIQERVRQYVRNGEGYEDDPRDRTVPLAYKARLALQEARELIRAEAQSDTGGRRKRKCTDFFRPPETMKRQKKNMVEEEKGAK